MSGINCRLIVCILAVFKDRIDNYLVRAGYTLIRTCGLSISQRLPCPQPLLTELITDVKALLSDEIGCYVGDRWAIDLCRAN